jgi:hypothetical protein
MTDEVVHAAQPTNQVGFAAALPLLDRDSVGRPRRAPRRRHPGHLRIGAPGAARPARRGRAPA